MSEVKLEKGKQKKLKTASKAVYIIAKIAKIFTIIGVVLFFLGMSVAIAFVNNVNVKDDSTVEMKFGSSSVEFKEEENHMELLVNGEKMENSEIKTEDENEMKTIINTFKNNSKYSIIATLVSITVFSGAVMILLAITLKRLEELFKNIHDEDTPFTIENVDLIKKMTYFMIASILINLVGSFVVSLLVNMDGKVNINVGFNIISILVLYCLGFIFEYGYEIQQNSQSRIYGDENE